MFIARQCLGDTALGVVVGADLFTAISRTYLGFAGGGSRLVLLGLLDVVELGPEHFQSLILILELRAFLLALDDDARGLMGQTDGGLGLVDVLTARTAGLAGLEDQVGFLDLDFHVLHLGEHRHGGGGGLNPTL